MALELIVLGASGTYPTTESATTGYLVRTAETKIWLDAGTGTFANLQRHIDYFEVDKVIISHLHLDHVLDLYPYYYALRYSSRSRGPRGIEVMAPNGAEDHLRRILNDNGDCDFGGYFTFRSVASGESFSMDGLQISFNKTVHPVETLATKFVHEGRTLVVTSDTAPSASLVEFARGAHVLIAEASLQASNDQLKEVHMTANEAGRMASDAGVHQLILTHLTPGLDPDVSIAQAREAFEGRIQVAHDNLRIEL